MKAMAGDHMTSCSGSSQPRTHRSSGGHPCLLFILPLSRLRGHLKRCVNCAWKEITNQECALSPAISAVSFLSQERLVQLGLQSLASLPRASQVRDSRTGSNGFADRPVCKRWNFGSAGCKGYPACTYRHACLKCGRRSHRAIDCRERETAPAAAGEVQATANPYNNPPIPLRD